MMDKNEGYAALFALIRSALWGDSFDADLIKTDDDVKRVVNQARKQTVLGLASYALVNNAEAIGIGRDTLRMLHGLQLSIAQLHLTLNAVLVEVVKLFEQNGIDTVLLKGQGVAANYPSPTLRQCGDIDLYVGKENYLKACALLKRISSDSSQNQENEVHWHTEYKGVMVEIHRIIGRLASPARDKRFERWSVEQLTSDKSMAVTIDGYDINIPPVNFNAIYIFNHIWHHFMIGGIGLRQLCDWALFLHTYRDKIDSDELERRLKSFGLLNPWRILASIVVKYLGLPADECPLYEHEMDIKADQVIAIIIRDGNFGNYTPHKSERPQGYVAGKLHNVKLITGRCIMLLNIVPKNTLEQYIHYLYTGIKQVVVIDKLKFRSADID